MVRMVLSIVSFMMHLRIRLTKNIKLLSSLSFEEFFVEDLHKIWEISVSKFFVVTNFLRFVCIQLFGFFGFVLLDFATCFFQVL